MSDQPISGANVVIAAPAQQFTRTDQFQALFNGQIFIGKIDTDPTVKANQITVYVEQEGGGLLPVPQPLRTNAAGYPIYNGRIVKFVTTKGYSMALVDAYGVQMAYFNNVLKYDPDQLSSAISSADGLKLVGRAESVAQLRQIVGATDQWINVQAYTAGTHIGGGFFYWVDDISSADNGGTFFRVNANGGWRRDLPDYTSLNVVHFGAVPGETNDAIPAMQRMYAWSLEGVNAIASGGIFANGIVFPSGVFGVSSWNMGTAENYAFKMYGPTCFYGRAPRVTLVPLNKTTTTPVITTVSRRWEISGIHWEGKGSVQPFFLNNCQRGVYSRCSNFLSTDHGGRVFQIQDTIDARFDQFYSLRGRAAFLWVTWSNGQPGSWDHPTALELSNFNIEQHSGEFAFSAIRATQARMVNGWFDKNENGFDVSQGQWLFDTVIQENATNASAAQYAKIVHINNRFSQGAGLDFTRSGYDSSMDPSGKIPSWVTDGYELGRLQIDHRAVVVSGGVGAEYYSSPLKMKNPGNSPHWFEIGTLQLSAEGASANIRLVGTGQFDTAEENLLPAGTNYGAGCATIMIQNKNNTSKVPLSWYGEGASPVIDVSYILTDAKHARIFVRLRQYCYGVSMFIETNDSLPTEAGIHFYVNDVLTVNDAEGGAATKAPSRVGWNNTVTGFGFNFSTGKFLIDGEKVTDHAADYWGIAQNGLQRYVPCAPTTIGARTNRYTRSELPSAADGVYVEIVCTDAYATGSNRDSPWGFLISDGSYWIDKSTGKRFVP